MEHIAFLRQEIATQSTEVKQIPSKQDEVIVPLKPLSKNESAIDPITPVQTSTIVGIFVIFCFGLFINLQITLVFATFLLSILYFADLIFNLFLIIRSYTKSPEIVIPKEELKSRTDWPYYTILCPLYKEENVIEQFVNAIVHLDYPRDKLQVILLLEEDDVLTIQKATSLHLPAYFETLVVPKGFPKTKPRACNFGLEKAIGKFTVIYDAEDVPDADQLKKAVIASEKSDEQTVCIQAKLNFYNPHQNLITRLFTAEYSLWFDLVLTGLQSIKAPIPLGGTSNHFKTDKLKLIRGWDAYNVTEDADIGVRLAKYGFKTAMMDSTTYEEANSEIFNWLRQRTRWIKGYIQTYFVHMRSPQSFLSKKKLNLLVFNLVVGGKIMSLFINPIMWAITISYFLFRPTIGTIIESLYPPTVFYTALTCLVLGNFLYFYYYLIGCSKKNYDELMKFIFLAPIYWIGMSIAFCFAVYQFIQKPFYWSKTTHGLHQNSDLINYNNEELFPNEDYQSQQNTNSVVFKEIKDTNSNDYSYV